jgi:hypothetical protein
VENYILNVKRECSSWGALSATISSIVGLHST